MITATRTHSFCYGHRIVGHEGKCRQLHGHGALAHFTVASIEEGTLDKIGRVIDFAVINTQLCAWLEQNWDHRMLIWMEDPLTPALMQLDLSVRPVPFNPTAENLAGYLLHVVGPKQLAGTNVRLIRVQLDETPKCYAIATLEGA